MDPFIGEIKMFAGNFAPRGWTLCDGQLMPINEYSALFSLLGTTYGGDGESTFGLPDMRGRIPVHPGSGPGLRPRSWGARGGAETVALTTPETPAHSHTLAADPNAATSADPAGRVPANAPGALSYAQGTPDVKMASTANTGGSAAHENRMPYQCVNYIIALTGIYPSRS